MIEGAIFDVDGTLLDSMLIWLEVRYRFLESIGLKAKPDTRDKSKDMSLYQAACYFKSEYGLSMPVKEIMDRINSLIEDFYRNDAQPKDGVIEMLDYLADNNVKMCIASATDTYLLEAALTRCGMRHYFSEIFSCTDVRHGKDEPDIYRIALAHLGTEKSRTVIFEDAYYAIETAKRDGFKVVSIYDEFEPKHKEVLEKSDFHIDNLLELDGFKSFAESL